MENSYKNFTPKRILLIRFSSLGDLILVTPVIRELRKAYPKSEIVIVVRSEFEGVVLNNPHLDRVIAFSRKQGLRGLRRLAFDLNRWEPDLIVDLHRSVRSRLLSFLIKSPRLVLRKKRLLRFLLFIFRINKFGPTFLTQAEEALLTIRPLGIEVSDLKTELHITSKSKITMNDALSEYPPFKNPMRSRKPLIALVPSGKWELKKWPEEHFEKLLELIKINDLGNVVLLGGRNDEVCARLARGREDFCIDMHGKTTLDEAAAILKKCSVAICNDTGLMHIAEAVEVNVIAMMGPTTAELGFYPHRKGSRVLEKELFCRPCSRGGGICWRLGSKKCLISITPEEVLEVLTSMLRRVVVGKDKKRTQMEVSL